MKTRLFSPLLMLLIIVLSAKALVLFGRIQEQTTYASDVSASSVFVTAAYAKSTADTKSNNNATNGQNSSKIQDVKPKEQDTSPQHGSQADVPLSAPDSDQQKKNPQEIQNTNSDDKSSDRHEKSSDAANFTRSELGLLKELSKRRDKLDQDKRALEGREHILNATEAKIDQKVEELKVLQSKLEVLMKEYDQKENGKILRLVKIYETMKPQQAAKILNDLELSVLMKVVGSMKEIKVAPIIASMNPEKAIILSTELFL
jgi:flagellar motility protein MotE (MotC chaperone)